MRCTFISHLSPVPFPYFTTVGRDGRQDGDSAFISRGMTGREMKWDGKWDGTGNGMGGEFAFISRGTGRDGKSGRDADGTDERSASLIP